MAMSCRRFARLDHGYRTMRAHERAILSYTTLYGAHVVALMLSIHTSTNGL